MNTKLQNQIAERKVQADERGIANRAVHVMTYLGDIVDVEPTITDIGDHQQMMTPAPGVLKVYCDNSDGDRSLTIRFHKGDGSLGGKHRQQRVHISLGRACSSAWRTWATSPEQDDGDEDVVFSWRGRASDRGVVLGYIPGPWETRLNQLALYASEKEDKSAIMAEQVEEAAARKAWGLPKPTFEG